VSHAHDPHLAHHFDTPQQQFASGKLGMWVFLATEVLLFSGLFCAYAVYRANHPEVFVYAHKYLSIPWGAVNTVVLICSSLTMALGVHAAQTDKKRALIILLAATLLFACCFLGIKYVEYREKWRHGLLWGRHYQPHVDEHHGDDAAHSADAAVAGHEAMPEAQAALADVYPPLPDAENRSTIERAPAGPAGLAPPPAVATAPGHEGETPENVHLFFGIYFIMTGLHALHVIGGMGAIGWILVRSIKRHFSSRYFLPVDLVGLYWHLVDLIWIFLFPLLYLIH
jgi:cytochrome c oxidase subunit 3